MINSTRRTFCKQTAAATTGILASTLPLDAMSNLYDNKKLKLALIGCGGRGSGAAVQALTADDKVELYAMADAFRDRIDSSLNGIKEHFDGSKNIDVKEKNMFTGFDAYKKAIDLCDVVILTTPPGFRPLHFEYAINNDKHVFMEKPLATDAPGIRKVLEVAKIAKDKKLNVKNIDRVAHLIVHGTLHLLGFTHHKREEEKKINSFSHFLCYAHCHF